ncbi:hypothetical protein AAFF_G00294340 [Aldrovandia affinis]|uniref:Ig-like domain-containing protein n=1 Tax=Aldrovandia affinis TaxID=143900 RepID=A0AAD7R8Z0_9TELE|nr:hypothetical protein AAFF_G00294340 [Aldrovandia affinis]
MHARILLLFCFYSLKAQPVSQFPELVEVEAGGTVRLHCDVEGFFQHCYTVVWMRINPRTMKMSTFPQQARVFWLVDGEEKSGLTGSIWTKDGDAVIESTQNQVLVPAEVWERGAPCTCVVEFDGRIASKSVQRQDLTTFTHEESGDVCAVLLYGAIAGAALIITVMISIAVCLLRGRHVGNNGNAREPRRATGTGHRLQHSGSLGSESQTVDNELYNEVQYATLEEASLGRRTNIVLH